MAKQPYIPFYLGDYLKDTRILPLNVRGGWVDLLLYMWENNTKGELTGTYEEFSRLMTCSMEEAILVIQTLKQKKICDYAELGDGVMKITSRKQKKMDNLSKTRSESGKLGGNPDLVKQKNKKGLSKEGQKPEYEDDNESEIKLPKEGVLRNMDQYAEAFRNDYKLDEKVFMENGFDAEQLKQARLEFWNSKELDEDMLNNGYNDVQIHFLRFCRLNRVRLKSDKLNLTTHTKDEVRYEHGSIEIPTGK